TALENVMLPAELAGDKGAKNQATELLEKVGFSHRLTQYPSQLSGGEQQRVAIARAFIGTPQILFADEPSANLDSKNGKMIEELLFELNQQQGTTL
ncbi:ATP-binding cassette domain-containing protein, partial [Pseudoalteromonas rubra]